MRPIQEIIEEYRTLSQGAACRELAIFERDTWTIVRGQEETHGIGMEKWFTKNCGAKNRDVRLRAALLAHDEDVSELWRRIDAKDLSPSSALAVLRTAKITAANTGSTVKDAVTSALFRYDKLPFVSRSKDGYLFRRPRVKVKKAKKEEPKAAPASVPRERRSYETFWDDIKNQTETFLMSTLPHTDPVFIARMRLELMVMLRVVATDFKRSMVRALSMDIHAATVEGFDAVTRQELEEACLVLKMEPPDFKQPVDMAVAKNKWWRLAVEYHPDKTEGVTKDAWHEIMRSYEMLETYNSQLKKDGQNGDFRVQDR